MVVGRESERVANERDGYDGSARTHLEGARRDCRAGGEFSRNAREVSARARGVRLPYLAEHQEERSDPVLVVAPRQTHSVCAEIMRNQLGCRQSPQTKSPAVKPGFSLSTTSDGSDDS